MSDRVYNGHDRTCPQRSEQSGECSSALVYESSSKQGAKIKAVQQAKARGKEWSKHLA